MTVDPNVPTTEDRARLEAQLMAFEQNWTPISLAALIPELPEPGSPLRARLLLGLVQIDLRRRWQFGDQPSIEEYLFRYPELGKPEDVPVELVLVEYLARERAGLKPRPEHFDKRFPGKRAELERLVEPVSPHLGASGVNLATSDSGSRLLGSDGESIHATTDEGDADTLPEQFGRYRILKRLGQGGMGTVYLAVDLRLDRQVALKVPRFAPGTNDENLQRFYREARATATITHPNLCPLYDIGEVDGVPYLTMPYIEGWPLTRFTTREKRLSQFAIAATVRKIALAVHEAHKVGVIHRDLKPSNIMVNKRGEPIVMDFGLARWVHNDKEDVRLTKAGTILGAPVYMSPEQVYGDHESLGPACDVYSLGVILFELLTNRLPFEGANTTAVLAKTLMLEAPRPSVHRPDMDPLLEAICVRAMAKRVQDRYQTMQALADALGEYMRLAKQDSNQRGALSQSGSGTRLGTPGTTPLPTAVSTPTPAAVVPAATVPTRTTESRIADSPRKPAESRTPPVPSRQRYLPWILAGLGVLGLFVVPVLAVWIYRASVPRGELLLTMLPESASVEIALDGKPFDLARMGSPFSIEAGDHRLTVTAKLFEGVAETIHVEPGKVTRKVIDLKLRRPEDTEPALPIDAPYPALRSSVRAIAANSGLTVALTGGDDFEVGVWNLDRHVPARMLVGHTLPVTGVALSRTGDIGVSCSGDQTVRVWNLRDGTQRHRLLGHADWPRCIALDAPGVRAVSGDDLGVLLVWDVAAGNLVRRLQGHVGSVRAVVLSADGKSLLSAGDDGTVRLWEVESGKTVHLMSGRGDPIRSLARSPTGKQAVSGHEDGTIRVWNLETGRETRLLRGHSGPVRGLSFLDNNRLVSASSGTGDRTVRLWDATKGVFLHLVGEAPAGINAIVTGADASSIVGACDDGRLRGWHANKKSDRPVPPHSAAYNFRQVRRFDAPSSVERMAVASDGSRLFLSGFDGAVYLWDVVSGKFLAPLRGHKGATRAVAVSADGRFLASGGEDRQIRVWDLETRTVRILEGHLGEVLSLAFFPDGQMLASGAADRSVLVWDLGTSAVRHKLTGHTDQVTGVAVSPDGKHLVSVGLDGHFKVWDPAVGAALQSAHTENAGFTCVGLFPDGKRALVGGRDKHFRILDVTTAKQLTATLAHAKPVTAVAVSGCGRWHATVGEDGLLYRWNSVTGQPEQRLAGMSSRAVKGLAFLPDGRALVTGSLDRAVKFWEIARADADPAPLPDSSAVRTPSKTFTGARGDIEMVAMSPDGRKILAVGTDRNGFLWDVASGQMKQLVGHTARLHGCAFLPDGRRAVTCGWDKAIRVWDLDTLKNERKFDGLKEAVIRLAVSADGRYLASGGLDRLVQIREFATGRVVWELEGHTAAVWSVALSADGYLAVSGSYDRTVRWWDLTNGRPLGGWVSPGDIHAVALSPDGTRIAAAGKDKVVVLLDVATGDVIARFPGHEGTIAGVSFSPDGRLLASGGDDRTARVWSVETGREVFRAAGFAKSVWSVAFTPDGKQLLTGANDPQISLWDLPVDLHTIRVGYQRHLGPFPAEVDRIAIAPDGSLVATGCIDKSLRLIDYESGAEVKNLEGLKSSPRYVTFSADGKQVLATCEDGKAYLWSVPDGKPGRVFSGHAKWVWMGAFAPDGKRILTGGQDPWVLLHDVVGPGVQRFDGYPTGIHCLTFLPDGKRAILGGLNGSLGVWDLTSGEELQRWAGHTGAVSALMLSPDNRLLATCGYDGTVRLWDVGTGVQVLQLSASPEQLWTVAFDPSGRRIACGGKDGIVRIWDVGGGPVTRYAGHTAGVTAVRFTPDGRRVLSSSQDRTIRVWGLPAL